MLCQEIPGTQAWVIAHHHRGRYDPPGALCLRWKRIMHSRVRRPWYTPPVDTMGTSSIAMLFMREKMASRLTLGSMLTGGTCSHIHTHVELHDFRNTLVALPTFLPTQARLQVTGAEQHQPKLKYKTNGEIVHT